MLHMARMLSLGSHLSHISEATLQMKRELQWFKVNNISYLIFILISPTES